MPKTVAEIKKFHAGIISTPDSKDLPADAADYSLNVETVSSEGKVMGRKGDLYLSATGGFGANSSGASPITVGRYIVSSGGGTPL
jgi:hypothetical protein|tara:strand:- start:5707 stop:5961 length:255 start_codon:yes stop_codon:yes gene_type:complete